MTTLLSLPNEILIDILIAAPTTRTLLSLTNVNRRMRSIWLEHSQHIIVSAYRTKIPHIKEAIALTLVEAQYGELLTLGGRPALHLYLPRVLCNAGLAKSVCDAAYRDNCLYKITWATEDRYTELLRAYHLISYTLLAYDHPELRPSVTSDFLACTERMHEGNFWLSQFLSNAVPPRLTFSIGLYERNVHPWRDPIGDPEWPVHPIR
jgi:hypothetical protein